MRVPCWRDVGKAKHVCVSCVLYREAGCFWNYTAPVRVCSSQGIASQTLYKCPVKPIKPSMAAHSFNPSMREAEAGESLWSQLGLYREFRASQGHIMRQCQEKKKEKEEKSKKKKVLHHGNQKNKKKIEIILFHWSRNFNDVSFLQLCDILQILSLWPTFS